MTGRWMAGAAWLVALAGWGVGGVARAADAPPLAKYLPADVVAYLEHDGLDAHAAAWKATAANQVLTKTTLGRMLDQVIGQALGAMMTSSGQGGRPAMSSETVRTLATHLLNSGFASGLVIDPKAPEPGAILAVRGGGKPAISPLLLNLVGANRAKTIKVGGKSIFQIDAKTAAWFEGEDFVFVTGGSPGLIAAVQRVATSGGRPGGGSLATMPARLALATKAGGLEPMLWAVGDLAKMPALPPQAVALGLDAVKGGTMCLGFRGTTIVSRLTLEAPAPRRGILALFEQPAFLPTDLPPIPAGSSNFAVVSVDPSKVFDELVGIAATISPDAEAIIGQIRGGVRNALGVDIRDDLLAPIGPRAAIYVAPPTPDDPLDLGMFTVPKVVLVADLKDPAAYAESLNKLVSAINPMLEQVGSPLATKLNRLPPPADANPKTLAAQFRKLKGNEVGYALTVPPGVFPLPNGLRPTVMIGKSHVAYALNPESAREALALEANPGATWTASKENLALFAGITGPVSMVSVSDPRDSTPEILTNLPMFVQSMMSSMAAGRTPEPPPEVTPPGAVGALMPKAAGAMASTPYLRLDPLLIPTPTSLRPYLFPNVTIARADEKGFTLESSVSLPTLGLGIDSAAVSVPVLVALLVPSVGSARDAARRAQSTNNLKQIALAIHNYESANGTFPPRALVDPKTKKPLLSWRVAILPYLEQQALYNEFHLDEPWDSPHNRKLAEDIVVSTYTHPDGIAPKGMTHYQVIRGKGTLFGGATGPRIADITDGTSNTIMVVEATEPVLWTKPDDLDFEPATATALPKLGVGGRDGFNAAFGDGSVKYIKNTVKLQIFKALATHQGNEVISSDSY